MRSNTTTLTVASIGLMALMSVSVADVLPPEPTLIVPLARMIQIEELVAAQQKSIALESQQKHYWYHKYIDLIKCIDKANSEGTPTATCLGDPAV